MGKTYRYDPDNSNNRSFNSKRRIKEERREHGRTRRSRNADGFDPDLTQDQPSSKNDNNFNY